MSDAYRIEKDALGEVRVPADRLIGEENRGWKTLMRGLNLERMAIAACGAGNAQPPVSADA